MACVSWCWCYATLFASTSYQLCEADSVIISNVEMSLQPEQVSNYPKVTQLVKSGAGFEPRASKFMFCSLLGEMGVLIKKCQRSYLGVFRDYGSFPYL